MDRGQEDRVARRWGDPDFTAALGAIHWMASPIVQGHLNRLSTGRADCDWLTWAVYHHIAPLPGEKSCLVLGCGDGWLERVLAGYPFIGRVEASDFAPAIVEQAAARTREAGLDGKIAYRVLDLNTDALPEEAYSVIVAHSVLHHVENLEHAFIQLHRALKPGGILLFNEYVGPSRFQFSDAQMSLINEVMACLPAVYRRSNLSETVYERKEVPTVEFMTATDPSEAVRSEMLPDLVAKHFEVVKEVPLGGTLLHHLLYDIVRNFDPNDEKDASLLRLMCFLEEHLVGAGRLSSDFLLMVARKGAPGRPPLRPSAHSAGASRAPAPPGRMLRGALLLLKQPIPAYRRPGLESEGRRRALHYLATGDRECPWMTWVLHRYLVREGQRVLILRDPDGWLTGTVRDHRLRPIVSIGGGERGWRGGSPFDLVLANGALGLHPDPPRLLDSLLRHLAPDAILVGEEQVEPVPADGVWLDIAALLPTSWELAAKESRSIRRWFQRCLHPDLMRRIGSRLTVEVLRPYGGAIVEPVLARLQLPVRGSDVKDDALWRLICLIEAVLTDYRVVPSPFVCFAARARKPGG